MRRRALLDRRRVARLQRERVVQGALVEGADELRDGVGDGAVDQLAQHDALSCRSTTQNAAKC